MSEPEKWYVGAQNDCLYIIDQPPRPSNDGINPDHDTNPIAKVYPTSTPGEDLDRARKMAAAPDLLLAAQMMVAAPHDSARHHAYAALHAAIAKAVQPDH